jgi:hypothetical protein
MPATYEPIATTTLGSTSGSITFSSIPSTYTDLRIVLVGTSITGGTAFMYFNSDVGEPYNYSTTQLWGDGSTTQPQRYSNRGSGFVGRASFSDTIPQMLTVDIFNYAGSSHKTYLATSAQDTNGAGEVSRSVTLWRSTAAITSLTFTISGTFKIGTTATLYGIKAA